MEEAKLRTSILFIAGKRQPRAWPAPSQYDGFSQPSNDMDQRYYSLQMVDPVWGDFLRDSGPAATSLQRPVFQSPLSQVQNYDGFTFQVQSSDSSSSTSEASCSVIVSKDKEGKKPDIWSKKAVTRMLQLYLEDRFRDKFNDRFSKKKQVWDELVKALNADLMLAAPVTGEHCDTKFRILKKKYLDCIEKNNKTGASPKYCDHYELLDEIWGCSDQATPKAIGSSLKGLQKKCKYKVDQEGNDENEDEPTPTSRKRNRKSTSAAAEAFQNYMTERKEENSLMCDMLKRMHEDKIKMFGSFLEVFKKLTEKDI